MSRPARSRRDRPARCAAAWPPGSNSGCSRRLRRRRCRLRSRARGPGRLDEWGRLPGWGRSSRTAPRPLADRAAGGQRHGEDGGARGGARAGCRRARHPPPSHRTCPCDRRPGRARSHAWPHASSAPGLTRLDVPRRPNSFPLGHKSPVVPAMPGPAPPCPQITARSAGGRGLRGQFGVISRCAARLVISSDHEARPNRLKMVETDRKMSWMVRKDRKAIVGTR